MFSKMEIQGFCESTNLPKLFHAEMCVPNLKENGKQLCLLECKHTFQKHSKRVLGIRNGAHVMVLSYRDADLNCSVFTIENLMKQRLYDAATILKRREKTSR